MDSLWGFFCFYFFLIFFGGDDACNNNWYYITYYAKLVQGMQLCFMEKKQIESLTNLKFLVHYPIHEVKNKMMCFLVLSFTNI